MDEHKGLMYTIYEINIVKYVFKSRNIPLNNNSFIWLVIICIMLRVLHNVK